MNNVSFMGRETLLTAQLKKTEKNCADKFFNSREPIGEIKKTVTTAEEVATKTQASIEKAYKDSHAPIEKKTYSADQIAEAYKAAHNIQS